MDGQQPPKQADIIFGAVEGVYGPQNTPLLWQCIIAGTKECFEGHTHPQSSPKKHPQARRVVSHPFDALAQVQGLMWGSRGPFLLAAAMVVAVVTPVVFCPKATEILNNVKNTKLTYFYRIFLTKTVYCKTY
jgi:hypothetical protein